MIYRLLLVTKYVTTEKPRANFGCSDLDTGFNGTTIPIGEVHSGTIRGECWRTYNLGFHLSIIGANRQIFREAWTIFQIENFWTLVQVNKAGFGQQMMARGFPVATNGNQFKHIKLPVMKVTVKFPRVEGEEQSDVLLLAAAHLKEFTRALWTTKGASQMEVTIEVQRLPLIDTPTEIDLLPPFMKLRRMKRVCVWSEADQGYIDYLPRGITPMADINLTFGELGLSVKTLQRHLEAREWRQAKSCAEEHMMLMSDCKLIYGNRFVGIEAGIFFGEALFRGRAAKKIIISTSVCIAQVNLSMRLFHSCIRFAEHAIYVSRQVSGYLPTSQAVVSDEYISFIFVTRASAYIGLDRSVAARDDIQEARKLKPHSTRLAAVIRVWESKYGKLPEPAPPEPTVVDD